MTVDQLIMAVGIRDAAKIVALKSARGHVDAAYRGEFSRLVLRPVAELEALQVEIHRELASHA